MTEPEILAKVQGIVNSQLHTSTFPIDRDVTLDEIGFNSLDIVEIIMRIEEECQVDFPTDFEEIHDSMDGITIGELIDEVIRQTSFVLKIKNRYAE